MGLKTFAERTVRLHGLPFSLADRSYLHAVYRSTAQRIVIRAGRQVEKSTFLVNFILYEAFRTPGAQILFVCPRQEQASLFSNVRLRRAIRESSVLQRLLWPWQRPMPTKDIEFKNGSRVYVRSAFHSADAIRGISAGLAAVDEFQDLAPGELPVIRETMSHFPNGRLFLTGTPKLISNHLEGMFAASTACEWQVPCAQCQQSAILDEKVLGATALLCPQCQSGLNVSDGRWVARNPDSAWGEGYWISQLMAPWMNVVELHNKQQEYDPVRFRNEVLGLPTNLGDHLISREEIEACCEDRPLARQLSEIPNQHRARLVAGVDWGFGGAANTVLVIGHIDRNRIFRVVYLQRWRAHTQQNALPEIAQICRRFRIRIIAADGGGGGRINNRVLLGEFDPHARPEIYSIFYSAADSQPVREGLIWNWTVDRSSTIGTLFTRIKKRLLLLPRLSEVATFLEEFTCEVAVYDDETRRVKYTKAETHRDDVLHATNYAELVALRMPSV